MRANAAKNSVTHVHFAADNHRMMRPHNPCPSSPIAEASQELSLPYCLRGWPRALPGLDKHFSARSTPKKAHLVAGQQTAGKKPGLPAAWATQGRRRTELPKSGRSSCGCCTGRQLGPQNVAVESWRRRGQHSAPMHQDPRAATKPRCHCFKHTLWNAERRPAWQGPCCNWQVLAARPATCGRAVWRRVVKHCWANSQPLVLQGWKELLTRGKQSHRFWRLWSSVQASYFEAASTDDKTSRYRS